MTDAPHARLDDAAREHAALYAIRALDAQELTAFEAHLATCSACQVEVDSLEGAVSGLGLLGPVAVPPPDLKARLMARVPAQKDDRAQPWKRWPSQASDNLVFVGATAGAWETTDVAGVCVRRLFVDTAADRVTMLVRMDAGISYPAHEHGGTEECYVLEGDLRVGEGLHMRAGDYQRAERGSVHPVQSTDEGCLLLIVSSLHDEMIPASA